MASFRRRQRGVLLLALLGLTVVVAMFTGVMLTRSRAALYQGAHYRDGSRLCRPPRLELASF